MTGIREQLGNGVLAGFPVVDVSVTLIVDHVDSSENSAGICRCAWLLRRSWRALKPAVDHRSEILQKGFQQVRSVEDARTKSRHAHRTLRAQNATSRCQSALITHPNSITYKRVRNSLKSMTFMSRLFRSMRTLLLEVLSYEAFKQNTPGVYVPIPATHLKRDLKFFRQPSENQ